MAEALITQAVQARYLGAFIPVGAEEYGYWLNGKDPQVQLFYVAPDKEQKTCPNHSDYLRWRMELTRRTPADEVLDILRSAYD